MDTITTIPPRTKKENYTSYFHRLLAGSLKAKEAHKIHETWIRRHQSVLREKDCYQRIKMVLEELMKSGFLRADYIDTGMLNDDCLDARHELEDLHFEDLLKIDGAEWKYALLSVQLKKQGERRILIDEKYVGLYIDEMRDKLTTDDLEAFFSFATFTTLAYREIDRLHACGSTAGEEMPQQTDEQIAVNNFVNKIVRLANTTYDSWNGKKVSPGAHKPEKEIVIKRDELIAYIKNIQQNNPDELLSWCYPTTGNDNIQFCKYVSLLQKNGYFGTLRNNLLAKCVAPIIGLCNGTVSNYLSK